MHAVQGFKGSGFKVGKGFQEKAAQSGFQIFHANISNSFRWKMIIVMNNILS
jgi:hypothetical protein